MFQGSAAGVGARGGQGLVPCVCTETRLSRCVHVSVCLSSVCLSVCLSVRVSAIKLDVNLQRLPLRNIGGLEQMRGTPPHFSESRAAHHSSLRASLLLSALLLAKIFDHACGNITPKSEAGRLLCHPD